MMVLYLHWQLSPYGLCVCCNIDFRYLMHCFPVHTLVQYVHYTATIVSIRMLGFQ